MGEALGKATRQTLSGRILRTMGLFGGVQAATIALSIVRTKLVAIWLGPMGVALNTIFISTQDLIVTAAGLNLRTSGVRELSAADAGRRRRVAGMLLQVALLLAVAGMAATLVLSPALSLWTLGGTSDWWCFAVLSLGVGSAVYLDADLAVLQAYGRFKAMARVTLASATVCTCVAVPLYTGCGCMPCCRCTSSPPSPSCCGRAASAGAAVRSRRCPRCARHGAKARPCCVWACT